LLHDIGKLGVPEYVLLKPGRLTAEEFAKIKEHPSIGADILDPVKFPWPVLPVVKHHHERWDGHGYPDGLKGEEIPITARVLAVADVYDALTSTRSYRTAWTHDRAVEELQKNSGTHFDPTIVAAFLSVVDKVRATMADGLLLETSNAKTTVTVEIGPITTPRSTQAVRHIQRASSELWALYEVSQTLSTSLGLDDTLDILGRKLLAIFPDTGCVFLLRNATQELGQGNALFVRFAVGLNQEFLMGSCTLNDNSISAKVAKTHQTYIGPYEHDDLLLTAPDSKRWSPVGTALIVPIVHQGESLGTINLYHAEENAFGPHVQNLLETIAQRAAMALYNGLMYERTRSDAITDPLTGLANARYITQWIEDRIQTCFPAPQPFALLCLDLDSFKPINDNFGHQKGDTVLQDLARLFCGLVGENDLVGRNGGDEFVFLLHNASPHEAEAMARRIKAAVQSYNPHLYHPRLGEIRLGVSIGNACFPSDGNDMATLLAVADAAMYDDKTERKLERLVDVSRDIVVK
jgi:diguanylate cyclase (GGDEF)-like protein